MEGDIAFKNLARKVQVLHVLVRGAGNECAATWNNGNEAFGFQLFKRLPNRNQAHVKRFRQTHLIDPCPCYQFVAQDRVPDAILNKLNAEMVRMLKEPDVKQRLDTLAFTPVGGSRAEFAAFITSEIAKWGKAVRESGAKAE